MESNCTILQFAKRKGGDFLMRRDWQTDKESPSLPSSFSNCSPESPLICAIDFSQMWLLPQAMRFGQVYKELNRTKVGENRTRASLHKKIEMYFIFKCWKFWFIWPWCVLMTKMVTNSICWVLDSEVKRPARGGVWGQMVKKGASDALRLADSSSRTSEAPSNVFWHQASASAEIVSFPS